MNLTISAKRNRKKDLTISATRIISMLFIVICHLGSSLGNNIIAQFFNVGVTLFFIISGALYANKEILSPAKWFAKRMGRLYRPLLFRIMISVILAIWCLPEHFGTQIILNLLNLQGLQHLYTKFVAVDGPWFFTIIMICYAILIPYKQLEKKLPMINSWATLLLSYLLCFILSFFSIDISGIVYFITGYIMMKREYLANNKQPKILVMISLICLSFLLRIVAKYLFDNTNAYSSLFVPIAQVLFSISFISVVRWLESKTSVFIKIMETNIIQWIDVISVYVYVIHGFFIQGKMSMFDLGLPFWVEIILFSASTLVLSIIGYMLFEKTIPLLYGHFSKQYL